MPYIHRLIQSPPSVFKAALALSVVLHIALLAMYMPKSTKSFKKIEEAVFLVKLKEHKQEKEENPSHQDSQVLSNKTPASQEAPSAPTAEEWAFASKYTLKNSKGYRHSWGKQVRSMMGTSVEGADQGEVRFRIKIAPNGSIVQIDTLWKTSDKVEQLARVAIKSMPPPPPTPTGKMLVFDKTISFSPFANDDSPIYRDDCLPDPPIFKNPFAWDGSSTQEVKRGKPVEPLNPEELAECLKQLPQDSIDAMSAHDQRQLVQWGSNKLSPKN
ncbi:MAG: hypothetical protein RLZZ410_216 [Pseudomonadota bacterium]